MAIEEKLINKESEKNNEKTAFEKDNDFITKYPHIAFIRLFFEPFYILKLANNLPKNHELGPSFRNKSLAVGLTMETIKLAGYSIALYETYNYFR